MESNKPIWLLLLGLCMLWLAGSVAMSVSGLFDQAGEPPIYFGLFVGGPIAAFLLLYTFSKRVRDALLAIPLWAIVAVHALRFVGIFFIIAGLTGTMPPHFGWPAGIGDIVAAAVSIPLAVMLLKKYRSKLLHASFVAWNIFGLADLLMAISLGLLYSQSTVGILSEPSLHTQAATHMPLSLIPTFYVPVLILLHFLALKRRKELLPQT